MSVEEIRITKLERGFLVQSVTASDDGAAVRTTTIQTPKRLISLLMDWRKGKFAPFQSFDQFAGPAS